MRLFFALQHTVRNSTYQSSTFALLCNLSYKSTVTIYTLGYATNGKKAATFYSHHTLLQSLNSVTLISSKPDENLGKIEVRLYTNCVCLQIVTHDTAE